MLELLELVEPRALCRVSGKCCLCVLGRFDQLAVCGLGDVDLWRRAGSSDSVVTLPSIVQFTLSCLEHLLLAKSLPLVLLNLPALFHQVAEEVVLVVHVCLVLKRLQCLAQPRVHVWLETCDRIGNVLLVLVRPPGHKLAGQNILRQQTPCNTTRHATLANTLRNTTVAASSIAADVHIPQCILELLLALLGLCGLSLNPRHRPVARAQVLHMLHVVVLGVVVVDTVLRRLTLIGTEVGAELLLEVATLLAASRVCGSAGHHGSTRGGGHVAFVVASVSACGLLGEDHGWGIFVVDERVILGAVHEGEGRGGVLVELAAGRHDCGSCCVLCVVMRVAWCFVC